jgi:hypothetical protein
MATLTCASEITEKMLPDDTQAIFRIRLKEMLQNATLQKMHERKKSKADEKFAKFFLKLNAKLPFDARSIGDVTLAVSKNDEASVFIQTTECQKIVDSLRADKNFTTVNYGSRNIFHILITNDMQVDMKTLFMESDLFPAEKPADDQAGDFEVELNPKPAEEFFEELPNSHPLYFTIEKDTLLVISDNLAVMTRQIDLLEGRGASLADSKTPAVSLTPSNAEALVYGSIGKGAVKLARHGFESAQFSLNAANDSFSVRAKVTSTSAEDAAKIATGLNFFRLGAPMMIDAIGADEELTPEDRAELKEALQKLNIATKENAVEISLDIPVK